MARVNYAELNETIRYTMWSVFRIEPGVLPEEREKAGLQTQQFLDGLADSDVVVRGVYDVSGMRADADFMIWWHSADIKAVQNAYTDFRRTTPLGQASEPVWSNVAMHRPAEFNKSHVPAYLAGKEPLDYICVYPFVRSYEWYLLPDEERRAMMAEHGKMGREFPDVLTNTVPAFALGDYEWILAFEASELHRLLDLMWHLRYSETRLHVREETPFYTGHRVEAADLVARLP